MNTAQTYLEIKLPVSNKAVWMNKLKEVLIDTPVRWQNGFYHITLAFLNETPFDVDVVSIINKHLYQLDVKELLFDKLDVFTAMNAGIHIINLTMEVVPSPFSEWVNTVRQSLMEKGCVIESDFRLHVTLGRVPSTIEVNYIMDKLNNVQVPSFSLPLDCFDYRQYRGDSIRQWSLRSIQDEIEKS